MFLRATATHGEQRPFGYYRITRLADGRAIGGLGFKSQPDGGCVEIGYGLAPSARGDGYAAEAVIALLTVAADQGCTRRARKRRRESHMADVVAIAGWSLALRTMRHRKEREMYAEQHPPRSREW